MGVFPTAGVDERGMCVIRTATLDDPTSWRAWDGAGFDLQMTSPYVTGLQRLYASFCRASDDKAPARLAIVATLTATYT